MLVDKAGLSHGAQLGLESKTQIRYVTGLSPGLVQTDERIQVKGHGPGRGV